MAETGSESNPRFSTDSRQKSGSKYAHSSTRVFAFFRRSQRRRQQELELIGAPNSPPSAIRCEEESSPSDCYRAMEVEEDDNENGDDQCLTTIGQARTNPPITHKKYQQKQHQTPLPSPVPSRLSQHRQLAQEPNLGPISGTHPDKQSRPNAESTKRKPTEDASAGNYRVMADEEAPGFVVMADEEAPGSSNKTNHTSATAVPSGRSHLLPTTQADITTETVKSRENSSKTSLNNIDGTSKNSSTSTSSRTAQWFALETTPEDRLSYLIIKQELKEVLSEMLHFFKNRHWKKKLMTVVVVLASALVFTDLLFLGHIRHWINLFLVWMTRHPVYAEFAFIAIFVLSMLLFIPPTVLLIGAGWAFADTLGMVNGILAAVLSCFMGSVIGSLLSFVRARYMMRDLIELFVQRYPIVRAADQALQRNGFRIMLLLRLCPLIPYHGLNYLGGITGVSWEVFVFSLVGVLPYQILVIVIGASAGKIHNKYGSGQQQISGQDVRHGTNENQQMGIIVLTSAGVAFFVIALIIAFRFTKKELQKEMKIGENEMKNYISSMRRMSLIDLYDGNSDDENDADNEVEDVEVPDNTKNSYPQQYL